MAEVANQVLLIWCSATFDGGFSGWPCTPCIFLSNSTSGGLKDRATRGRGAVQFYSHLPDLPGIRRGPLHSAAMLAQTRAHYFRISSFFCSSFSPPMKCLVSLPASSFFYESCLSPVGTEPRSHMAPPLPEASVHFKRFVNPSLSLFLPSEDDGRTDRARPLIFPSTPLPVPAARPRARLETPTPPLPRTAGASGATCDGVGDSSSKYRRNSVFSVTQ